MDQNKQIFIANFYLWWSKNQNKALKRFEQESNLINEFIGKFTFNFIKNMTLEQYAIGRQNADSFCYWVERKIKIEDVRNPSGAAALYGIYWDKKINDYSFKSRFGKTKEEVFENIKKEILSLIIAVKQGNIQSIDENKLSPPFKGKLAFIFNWMNTTPIHSNEHLFSILSYLGIPTFLKEHSKNEPCENRFLKRNKLWQFVKSCNIPEMNPIILDSFLYDPALEYRSVLYSNGILKFNERAKTTLFTYAKNVKEIQRQKTTQQRIGLITSNPETEEAKRINGKIAEQYVLDYLNKNKHLFNIVGNIESTYKINDYAHFDISFKDHNGVTTYIEVKSSGCNLGNRATFFMSDAEYDFMNQHKENYLLFFVNNVNDKQEIIVFKPEQIKVKPIKYVSELEFER